MSWLWGSTDAKAPTFHPVSSRFNGSDLVGELQPQDMEWTCAGGFATETHTFYNFLEDGTFLMCQVVHSSVGLWYPNVQFTFKMYNPHTKEKVWRSANVSNFTTPPPGLDKRSSKSDAFTITYKSAPGTDTPESYIIHANASKDVQVSLVVTRPASAPGWKIGNGPQAGYSYYGADPAKADGYVIHRFWPQTMASGHVIYKGKALPANGPGMLVHMIMGMRPDTVATRWNFAHFQSEQHGGVSAIQMELTTTDAFGKHGAGSGGVKVNIGSLVLGGKLACVSAETTWPGEAQQQKAVMSRAFHIDSTKDSDTSYAQPRAIEFVWAAPSLVADAPGQITADLKLEVGLPTAPIGLIEKVDVLAEIPAVIKAVISYVAGTKPYIYQWINAATLKVTAPDALLAGGSGGVSVEGTVYIEASFVS